MVKKITVEAAKDHLERQATASPAAALAELIWNSLDGDATEVNVNFENHNLDSSVSKIIVHDNGEGFTHEGALRAFGQLGGSLKKYKRQTTIAKREVHGQEGKGRYKAIALGGVVEWQVCYLKDKKQKKSYTITIKDGNLNRPEISDEEDAGDKPLGVTVEITNIKKNLQAFNDGAAYQDLCEIFALYLTNYKDPLVFIDGVKLDPKKAMVAQKKYNLGVFETSDSVAKTAFLEIIEWSSKKTKNILYLSTEKGFPLHGVDSRFQVGNYYFSAYLQHPYIDFLQEQNRIAIPEFAQPMKDIIDSAHNKIIEHFREKTAEQAKSVVDTWKLEKIYPYDGEAITSVEKAERQVFDIIAVTVQDFLPDISMAKPKAKALHLNLLKNAIEKSPTDLQIILTEVLGLPKARLKDLAGLLQETSLSSIIETAKTIADRLKFLTALESIVFDHETKGKLKERSQLHKIVAENTWIFGEEYNLWVSDGALKKVLIQHKKHLDPTIVIDEPVKIVGQKTGIVDLMLSRSIRKHRSDDIENLVIELKAPKVSIGDKEITQIEKYSLAVIGDERFNSVPGLKWHFWVISNKLDDFATYRINGGADPARRVLNKQSNMIVGIKTWGEIIEENKARLQFIKERLEHNVDESSSLKFLQEKHREILEGVFDTDAGTTAAAE